MGESTLSDAQNQREPESAEHGISGQLNKQNKAWQNQFSE